MAPEFVYFLKINIGIALFYAFYRLFFYRDTFFHWRRYALLAFMGISFLYPLLNIQDWVKEQEPMKEIVTIYAANMLPEVTPQQSTLWEQLTGNICPILYWLGIGALILRFLVQLVSICIIARRSRKVVINGITIRIPEKSAAPFSFFHWIFISPELHTENEFREILIHEETHTCQWHSADVVLSELFNIFCWVNPFAWLIKREIRNNLEYMADNRVVLSIHDTKSYQYHLLGLASQKASAHLCNSFNILPLKNRIVMMNKRRTKGIAKTKYVMFFPLAALLMLFSNIEAVARITGKFAEEIISPLTTETSNNADAEAGDSSDQERDGDTEVYTAVESMPRYPGGEIALLSYISRNLKYPTESKLKGVEGKVYVRFVVTKTGEISNARIMRSLDKDCDAEAIRVIMGMPRWEPGKQNGKVVNVYYVIPISFRLNSDKSATQGVEGDFGSGMENGETNNKNATGEGSSSNVYTAVEQMPQFPGGETALMRYIFDNIKYPSSSHQNGVQGKVYTEVTISETGEVKNAKILRSLDPFCDAEALRVVNSLPKWIPGKQNGVNVPVKYVLPITFKLQ
ncbi:M56 family metallopeptidase [Bacteroides sedimenti]|uniref:Cell envelope biogenesis protein TonB n=1 Tax=Bacteroides sedimenti TaxID=2136147 RepID=A0ABM8I920_9BACE